MLKIIAIENPKKRRKAKKTMKVRKPAKVHRRKIAPKKKRRTRIIRVKRNRARMEPQRYMIQGIFLPRRGFQKTVYFTGEGFSPNRDRAKEFSEATAKSEARRILPQLPPKIDRIWTQAA